MPPTQVSAHHPSPKRKRDQAPHVPLLNTALRPASTPPRGSSTPSSGADSPRNAVADQLRGMTLTAISAIPMLPLTPTDDVVRKKPKLDMMGIDSEDVLEDFSGTGSRFFGKDRLYGDVSVGALERESSRETLQTPQSRPPPHSQQPRTFSDIFAFAQPTIFTSSSANTQGQKPTLSGHASNKSKSRSSQPRQRNKSPSPPLSSLTWQDSEITGHLADPSVDPEDDGTGLNGIGFKPTPAIAYARAQRRRQQLMDWKAREAREARAKRSERRRRGVGGIASREATVERDLTTKEGEVMRRTVKFAL